ncbi:MAG: CoA transferase [Actinobacteria bacterium]|nr:CoA transferase [Actinomycetota bacterium]
MPDTTRKGVAISIDVIGGSAISREFIRRLLAGFGITHAAAQMESGRRWDGRIVFDSTYETDPQPRELDIPVVHLFPYEFTRQDRPPSEEFIAAATTIALHTRPVGQADSVGPPSPLPSHQAEKLACLNALFGLLAAIRQHRMGYKPVEIFVSWERSLLYVASRPMAALQAENYLSGRGGTDRGVVLLGGLLQAADGPWYVRFNSEGDWERFVSDVLHDPPWCHEEWCRDPQLRNQSLDRANAFIADWIRTKRRWDAFWICQNAKVNSAIPMTVQEATAYRGYAPATDGLPVFRQGERLK